MHLLPFRTLFLLFLSTFILYSCEEEAGYTSPPSNDQLMFPNSLPFDISQGLDEQGQIHFTQQESAASLIYIGIFSSPPQVIDDELANSEALVWEWQGTRSAGEKIKLPEGIELNNAPSLNPSLFECDMSDYYWAAWSWDNTAQYITHSTLKGLILSTPSELPSISLISATIIGETPNDTLLIPGQEVSLRLEFLNNGESIATAGVVTLTQPAVTGFPLAINLADLPANESIATTVDFVIPSDFSFGDQLDIQIKIDYNDCLEYATTTSLTINALNVCLIDVRLIDIRYLPLTILWDPTAILSIFFDPDVYFELSGPGSTSLYQSIVLEDVTDDWPNTPTLADWPNFTPCFPLDLDSLYTITFWDEDLDADDFIGTLSFQAVDYLAEQQQVVTITNDEVMVELYFEWE